MEAGNQKVKWSTGVKLGMLLEKLCKTAKYMNNIEKKI